MELSIERIAAIEEEFLKSLRKGNSRIIAYCHILKNAKCIEEIKYINEAYKMPIEEIYEAINRYPNSSVDALEFMDKLCRRYNVDRKVLIERIGDTIAISNYIKKIASQNETKDMDENNKRK